MPIHLNELSTSHPWTLIIIHQLNSVSIITRIHDGLWVRSGRVPGTVGIGAIFYQLTWERPHNCCHWNNLPPADWNSHVFIDRMYVLNERLSLRTSTRIPVEYQGPVCSASARNNWDTNRERIQNPGLHNRINMMSSHINILSTMRFSYNYRKTVLLKVMIGRRVWRINTRKTGQVSKCTSYQKTESPLEWTFPLTRVQNATIRTLGYGP